MQSQEELDEYKMKQRFDYLTSDLLRERKKQTLAKMRCRAYGNIFFFISATITFAQAIMATLAQGKTFSDTINDNMMMAIAILAAFSVFWQSLIKHFNHDATALKHESAADAMRKIHSIAVLRCREEDTKMKYVACIDGNKDSAFNREIIGEGNKSSSIGEDANDVDIDVEGARPTHAENVGSSDEEGDRSDFHTLTKQFEQAIESSSQIPPQISSAFELLDNRIGVCKTKVHTSKSSENERRIEWEKVYPSLYRQLAATIISQPGWPYFYPNPDKVVEEAMGKYYKTFEAGLLKKLLSRDQMISNLYEKLEEGEEIS